MEDMVRDAFGTLGLKLIREHMKHIGPYEARKMVRAARDNSDYFIYAVFCLIYVEVFVAPTED